MAARPDSMGIYAEYQKKREGAYDIELEGRVREWIEGNLGRKLEGPFRESLMDGIAVCDLINKLKPGKITKIHNSKILMFRRENFGFFQRSCVDLGCLDNETAVFEDVYDNRNMGLFLTNIIALARNTQYQPGYKGPLLQDAVKKAEQQKMNFTKEQLARGYSGPTAAEQAANKTGEAKDESRYVEHGIINNANEHQFHGQKH